MGLVIAIAGATVAALKTYNKLQSSGRWDPVTTSVKRVTGVIMAIATAIRSIFDALMLVAPMVTTRGPQFGARRIGDPASAVDD